MRSRLDPDLAKILSLFEDLLIFHSAVFHKKIWWSFEKKRKWEGWVRKIIKNIPIILPQVLGNAWKFPKVHLQKHLPSNIQSYGAPLNFDCTNGEHALQEFAKDLSKTVAKNTNLYEFNLNLATRLQQHQIQLKYINEYKMTDCPFIKKHFLI